MRKSFIKILILTNHKRFETEYLITETSLQSNYEIKFNIHCNNGNIFVKWQL